MRHRILVFCCLAVQVAPLRECLAWQANGIPVCIAAGSQVTPACVPDGTGGAIIVWLDLPNGNDGDIYAQRITGSGAVAPGWPSNGLPVCVQPGHQGGLQGWFPVPVIEDGFSGAFIAWHDYRSGTDYDIYLQRITAHGKIAPGWPLNGRLICDAPMSQSGPVLAPDGTGGVFLVWADNRTAPSDDQFYLYGDLYAQRVSAQGSIAPGWPTNGLAVSTVMNASNHQTILADGSGGAFIAASELGRMNMHRITSSGARAAGWPAEGVNVGADACSDGHVQLISDGAGGVIAGWEGFGGACQFNASVTHIQRLTGQGLVAPGWPQDAFYIGDGSLSHTFPRVVANGAGGVLFTWDNGAPELYLQQLDSSGTVAPGWPSGQGVALSTYVAGEPDLVSDGLGGAIVAWTDFDNVLAQRRLNDGSIAPGWPVAVAAPGQQKEVRVTTDNAGGAVFVWTDTRNGNADIYCLRLGPTGLIPTAVYNDVLDRGEVGPTWPNPFREEVSVLLRLTSAGPVSFQIFDTSGRRIYASRPFWSTSLLWNGRDHAGLPAPNGVYFMQILAPTFSATRKVVLSR